MEIKQKIFELRKVIEGKIEMFEKDTGLKVKLFRGDMGLTLEM